MITPRPHIPSVLELHLPDWLTTLMADTPPRLISPEARMRFVLDLVRRQIEAGTGGPFAAAVFEHANGQLIAAGVNQVVPGRCSTAHAEIVALTLAQQACDTHDLGAEGLPAMELVASTEPCAMCLGAIPWSGVRRLLYGAYGSDAEAIGFDEGDKPAEWHAHLAARGITVQGGLLHPQAVALLHAYVAAGGPIYNGRAITAGQGRRI